MPAGFDKGNAAVLARIFLNLDVEDPAEEEEKSRRHRLRRFGLTYGECAVSSCAVTHNCGTRESNSSRQS